MTTADELGARVAAWRRDNPRRDADVLGAALQPCDRGQDYVAGDNCYTWWHAVGAVLAPRAVLEVGARFGYSVRALLAHTPPAEARVFVVDADCDPGCEYLPALRANLAGCGAAEIHKADSQTLTSLLPLVGAVRFDVGSVDALHTADGCEHDCELVWACLRPGGVLLVDDVLPGGPVRVGADRFLARAGAAPAYLPSLRGLYLAVKP